MTELCRADSLSAEETEALSIAGEEGVPVRLNTSSTTALLLALDSNDISCLYRKPHGRASVAITLALRLSNEGFDCQALLEESSPGEVIAAWTSSMDAPGDLNPEFPLVQTVRGSLLRQIREAHVDGASYYVQPVYNYRYRVAGWQVRQCLD